MKLYILFLFVFVSSIANADSSIEAFIENQQKIATQFQKIEKELHSLPSLLVPEQKHILFAMAYFFQNELLIHLQQEQKEIIPLIQEKGLSYCLSSENVLLTQWIGNAQYLTNVEKIDISAFIVQVHDLIGGLKLHFNTVKDSALFLTF